jgi:hypothetical protein
MAARLIQEDEPVRVDRAGELDKAAPQFVDARLGLLGRP